MCTHRVISFKRHFSIHVIDDFSQLKQLVCFRHCILNHSLCIAARWQREELKCRSPNHTGPEFCYQRAYRCPSTYQRLLIGVHNAVVWAWNHSRYPGNQGFYGRTFLRLLRLQTLRMQLIWHVIESHPDEYKPVVGQHTMNCWSTGKEYVLVC